MPYNVPKLLLKCKHKFCFYWVLFERILKYQCFPGQTSSLAPHNKEKTHCLYYFLLFLNCFFYHVYVFSHCKPQALNLEFVFFSDAYVSLPDVSSVWEQHTFMFCSPHLILLCMLCFFILTSVFSKAICILYEQFVSC